jgi:hypothetical protein
MKARFRTLLVDLLIDGFSLLIRPERTPGITVSTIAELAAALSLENSSIDYPQLPENERRSGIRAIHADSPSESIAVCASADRPPAISSSAWREHHEAWTACSNAQRLAEYQSAPYNAVRLKVEGRRPNVVAGKPQVKTPRRSQKTA